MANYKDTGEWSASDLRDIRMTYEWHMKNKSLQTKMVTVLARLGVLLGTQFPRFDFIDEVLWIWFNQQNNGVHVISTTSDQPLTTDQPTNWLILKYFHFFGSWLFVSLTHFVFSIADHKNIYISNLTICMCIESP